MCKAFMVLFFLLAIAMIITVIYLIIALFRNTWVCKQQIRIIDAICAHHMSCIIKKEKAVVNYTDMERYEATFNRFWDWGCTRILPKRKFAIIKPYIDAPKCFCNTVAVVKMGDNRNCDNCKFADMCLTQKGNDKHA